MNRLEKKQFVSDFKDELSDSSTMILVHYQGLTVKQMSDLRTKLREKGSKLQVIKNRVTKIAMNASDFKDFSFMLKGPAATVVANEPVAVSKVLTEFAKDNDKLKIVAGYVSGAVVDAATVDKLSKLPSLDELRGKIVGVLVAPAQKVLRILNTPGERVARVINQYSQTN